MPKLAVIQMSMTQVLQENVDKGVKLVREAAARGAQIILLPELFENYYFCQLEREEYFELAHSSGNAAHTVIFPKRAFASNEELEAFRRLASAGISKAH